MQWLDKFVILTFKTKLRKSHLKSTNFKVPNFNPIIFEFGILNVKVLRFEFKATFTIATHLSWISGIVHYSPGSFQFDISKVLLLGLLWSPHIQNFGGNPAVSNYFFDYRYCE